MAVPFALNLKQTHALTCSHLCLCPQMTCTEVSSCSGSALRLSPADCQQSLRDSAPRHPGAALLLSALLELLQRDNWQENSSSFFLFHSSSIFLLVQRTHLITLRDRRDMRITVCMALGSL